MAFSNMKAAALSCLLMLSGCSVLQPTSPPAEAQIPDAAQPAIVTYVHDGDTLYLSGLSSAPARIETGSELKVRLIGVDTPELEDECYAEEARELLRDLLPEGTGVWALEDEEPLDRYGRSLLYVFTDEGELVNLTLVALGAGTAVRFGQNDEYWDELQAAEQDAQSSGLGMWGACST